jgi:chondroitin 4-sulfotransferase 11
MPLSGIKRDASNTLLRFGTFRERGMVSHDHQCIFTHVPKTAGKSIRYLFGLPEFEHQHKADGRNVEYGFGHRRLFEFVNEKYFAGYFKFAFVRNPFDRIVSAYFYLDNGGCNAIDERFRQEHLAPYKGDFDAFVEDLSQLITAPHFQPQVVWLCDNRGNLLADFIGRYERLEQDASVICTKLRLPFCNLPLLNTSKHNFYGSYYDDATKRRVAQAYGEDLELFCYRFD